MCKWVLLTAYYIFNGKGKVVALGNIPKVFIAINIIVNIFVRDNSVPE